MKMHIIRHKNSFEVQPVPAVGMCHVGTGPTMDAALASFLRIYQKELGITEITLDEGAQRAELARRSSL